MSELVENKYKSALGDDLPSIRGSASVCSFSYASVQRALDNGAWQSTTADSFSTSLRTQQTDAERVGGSCESALQSAYDNAPAQVAPDHPHATWVGW